MKQITTINFNASPMTATSTTRGYSIIGDPGAMFSLRVINKSQNYYYNFPENTDPNFATPPSPAFAAAVVELNPKTIDSSGVYNGIISFPLITGNDGYKISLLPKGNTVLSESLSFENSYESPVYIKQFSDTKITFSLLHSNSAVVEPANEVSSGINHVFSTAGGETLVKIDWDITLGSSQCIVARQPIATDFEFTTTEVTRTSKTADLSKLELKDVSKLKLNMDVSGTGINACIIKGINKGYYDANNSTVNNPVYKSPVILETNAEGKIVMVEDKGGTITLSVAADVHVADRVITFTGKGPSDSKQFNNTDFSISNFKLTIDPVVTTTDAAVANSTTIPITSTNGIKAADTILMSGIGVTTTAPHVDTVNSGVSVVVSAAQTIENGQTVTFTGSSRVAKITADIIVKDHGDSDITLKLNLDNILTVG